MKAQYQNIIIVIMLIVALSISATYPLKPANHSLFVVENFQSGNGIMSITLKSISCGFSMNSADLQTNLGSTGFLPFRGPIALSINDTITLEFHAQFLSTNINNISVTFLISPINDFVRTVNGTQECLLKNTTDVYFPQNGSVTVFVT